jgi:uroporphyrinogen-III synthase
LNVIISFRNEDKFTPQISSPCKVINIPLTKIVPIKKGGEISLTDYDALVFTSSTGVDEFFKMFSNVELLGLRVFAIGKITGDALIRHGIKPLIPDISDSEHLANFIVNSPFNLKKVLIPRGMTHRNELQRILLEHEIESKNLYMYQYKKLDQGEILLDYAKDKDTIIFAFTSSMEARIFKSLTGKQFIESMVVPLGKPTYDTLVELGFKKIINKGFSEFYEMIKEICQNSGEWI